MSSSETERQKEEHLLNVGAHAICQALHSDKFMPSMINEASEFDFVGFGGANDIRLLLFDRSSY